MTTTSAPSRDDIASILHTAHDELSRRGWTQGRPCDIQGHIHALSAIGLGAVGWHYDPRRILTDQDQARYDAAIAHLSKHLGLPDPDDPEQFIDWHDSPERTQYDVLDALEDTARALEGWTPARQFTPTAADMTAVHDGVALDCYGEDSSCIALGHIDPALMVDASAAFLRDLAGEPCDRSSTPAELQYRVQRTWAVYWHNEQGEQWFDLEPDQRTPGAVPVTILLGD
ncbi:hypothetical protein [Streptomyces sp. ME19-01-6]|uniref:DUF6197 family protein n=1 Tax=Streptomyces sp. ME19-01-6 TaxID=3028686 RepID=UPI0029A6F565|nr:hypothetical protein [Streptomyces sp. ME19-01-6]MDX3232984.1 hypothetical protein [Streptomyces sp. ME19-01-6]